MIQRGPLVVAALMLLLVGCGEPPAPAAVSKEFDDPFADEPAEVAPAVAVPAPAPVEVAPVDGEPAEAEASAAGEATPPAEVAAAPEAVVAPPEAAAPPVEEAAPTKTAAPTSTATPTKKSKAAPTKESPVPSDSRPEPTPTPVPEAAPEPAPEPAPVATKPAPETKPEPPPQPPQLRFVGSYKFAGGATQRAEVEAAIEAAAQQVNAVIRGIARKRLTESNVVRETIVIAVDGERVSVTFAAGRTVTGTLGGPAVDWTSDSGKPVKVAFSIVKGRLVLNFTADDGSRRSTFTLNDAGDRMTLSVTVSSDRLETPMKYALTYRRG